MEKFVSHLSAAYEWDIPYIDNVFEAGYLNKRKNDNKIDRTVTNVNSKYQKKNQIIHLCKHPLPTNAIVKKNGHYVSSPELVFFQLATELDIHRLILLGILMCSHKVGRCQEAVTTKRKLERFVKKMSGYRGCAKARDALKYVDDGAASFQEACAFMMLTLPHRLGGFGLGDACFNHGVLLKQDAQERLRQERCYVDIYYPKARIGVEYNSYTHHQTPKEQGWDTVRASALERQKINIINLTTIQLYDKREFGAFALNLASRLGTRIRNRARNFEKEHANLRRILTSDKNI